jgi:hypothetical protein
MSVIVATPLIQHPECRTAYIMPDKGQIVDLLCQVDGKGKTEYMVFEVGTLDNSQETRYNNVTKTPLGKAIVTRVNNETVWVKRVQQ